MLAVGDRPACSVADSPQPGRWPPVGGAAGLAAGAVGNIIGDALVALDEAASIPSEGFLAAFLIVAVALDVAVDGAIYLARREDDGSVVAAIGEALTDGGER